MEVEYIVVNYDTMEIIWLRQLLEGIGVVQIETTIECDNQGCFALTKNPKHHQRPSTLSFNITS